MSDARKRLQSLTGCFGDVQRKWRMSLHQKKVSSLLYVRFFIYCPLGEVLHSRAFPQPAAVRKLCETHMKTACKLH